MKPFIGKPFIKVLVGQRRVGKSVLLQIIADELEAEGVQIIYIDKESYEFDSITDYKTLNDFINTTATASKVAVFIDEVQEIAEFEKSLRNFYKKTGFDIYITGSNANLLSGELATLLSGRFIEIEVFPLDYREFLVMNELTDTETNCLKFLQFGGMPGLSLLPDEPRVKREYLLNIYNSILYRDIIKRNQIRNIAFLENLVNYIADNAGSQLSAKKISDYLKSQRIQLSINTVIDYLTFLTNAFIVRKVKRQDLKGKKIFEVGEKYYFEDLGIRNNIVGFSPNDIQKVYENVVFNHLKSNGYAITTGAFNDKEIDFIATKDGETSYFQVAYLLIEPTTIEREFGNLLLLNDNYPKYVISQTVLPAQNTYKGIQPLSLRQFLFDFQ
ncbi:MAG: ATP-binding protein [Spirosomataceae bacterium]